MTPIAWSDPAYPAALTTIADPPPVLWIRGRVDGARARRRSRSSDRARRRRTRLSVAAQLAGDLAACGLVVVSGLARGVDSAAHRGALAGGGVDRRGARVGRRRHLPAGARARWRATSQATARSSASSCRARRRCRMFFPRRNRIISGLSRAVVVDRGGREERLAHHRAVRARAGARRAGGARQRAERPQPRRPRAVAGRCKDRGVGGRYPGGAGDGPPGQAAGCRVTRRGRTADRADREPDPVLACLTPGEPCDLDAISERSGPRFAASCCRGCSSWSCRAGAAGRRRPVRTD